MTKKGIPNLKNSKPKIQKTCLHCGTVFLVHPYRKNTALYCSTSCHISHRTGENAVHWQGGQVEKVCQYCGKTYMVIKARINKSHYCSNSCCSRDNNSGSKSYLWKGGISFAPYPTTFNNAFKKMIRKRDSYTCQICGKRGKDIHHINYMKNDTTPDNCITLCRSCHTRTNANRESWQEYFSSKYTL